MPTSSDLCRTCGFCCNGVLYGLVDLLPGEVEWAERRKLPLLQGDTIAMRQPCALFTSECSAYDERPSRCREYTCHLLTRYMAGDISLSEATATVERARALSVRAARVDATGVDAQMDAATLRWALIRDFDERLKR